MKTKTFILSLGLAAALPFTAQAGMDAEDKAEHVTQMLNLDRARAQQVEQVFKNYEDQHQVLKDQKEEQLDSILTDEEMDKFEEMKKAKREKREKKYKEWKKD